MHLLPSDIAATIQVLYVWILPTVAAPTAFSVPAALAVRALETTNVWTAFIAKCSAVTKAFAPHIQTVPMAVQIVNRHPGRRIQPDMKNAPPQRATQRRAFAVKKQNTDVRPDITAPVQMAHQAVQNVHLRTAFPAQQPRVQQI